MLKHDQFEDTLLSKVAREMRDLRKLCRRPARKKTWKAANGRRIRYVDMTDSHLLNTIHYLRRAEFLDACEELRDMSRHGMDEDVSPELANRKTADVYPAYKYLMKEANKRELEVDLWCSKCQRYHDRGQTECVTEFCEACNKAHPVPINHYHAAKLQCLAKETPQ
jgi:hypothetical protein